MLQVIGFGILFGNFLCDLDMAEHVRLICVVEGGKLWNDTGIPGLREVYDSGLDWNTVRIIFIGFSLFSFLFLVLSLFGTVLRFCVYGWDNSSPFQKCIVWINLFLNDLPQCILTSIVTSMIANDSYLVFIFSTLLGVLGNYILFFAFSKTTKFHYPRLFWCHVVLTVISFSVLINFMLSQRNTNLG